MVVTAVVVAAVVVAAVVVAAVVVAVAVVVAAAVVATVVAAAPEDFCRGTTLGLNTRPLLVCICISRYIAVIKYILSNYLPDTA